MKTITVYIDESCGACKKVKKILKPLVIKNKVVFKFAEDMDFNPDSEAMINRYTDLFSYDGEKFYKGYDTYTQISRRSYVMFPLFLFMKIPFVKLLGNKIYQKISKSRTCKI